MCSGCWELRAAHVQTLALKPSRQTLAILVLGFLAVFPMMLPFQVATIVGSVVLLRRRQQPPAGPRIALGLALLGLTLSALFMVGLV